MILNVDQFAAIVVVVVDEILLRFEVFAFSVQASPNDCAVFQMHPITDFPMTNDQKNL